MRIAARNHAGLIVRGAIAAVLSERRIITHVMKFSIQLSIANRQAVCRAADTNRSNASF